MKPAAIKSLRKHLKLTADAFAAQVGLAGVHREVTVYKWESGKKRPSSQTVFMLTAMRASFQKTKQN